MNFRKGTAHFLEEESRRREGGALNDAYLLPDSDKERLCRSLLAEFGVTHVRMGGRGELIHGCILPFGNHSDQDHNPTASLNYEKLAYNCFGCGSGGSLLWFVGLMRDVSGSEARRWLEGQTGLGEDAASLSTLMEFFDAIYSKDTRRSAPMPHMDAKILKPWQFIHPYMTEIRHIPEAVLMKFNVGYGTVTHRKIKSERIIIPHFWEGTLVGWQSRRLTDDGTPKYLNSPEFPKDRTIYNYDKSVKTAVIVESPMSVLSKSHVYHIEAVFGAEVTDRQMRLIARHPKVYLFMDNDQAGYTATQKLGDYLMAYSEVYVANNVWNADPADMTDEEYIDCIQEALPYSLWTPPAALGELVREDVMA